MEDALRAGRWQMDGSKAAHRFTLARALRSLSDPFRGFEGGARSCLLLPWPPVHTSSYPFPLLSPLPESVAPLTQISPAFGAYTPCNHVWPVELTVPAHHQSR